MTDVVACGTYTYHRGLNAECSLIHSAYWTNLPFSPVTAQFICSVLPCPSSPCLSILRSVRGLPPSLSISLAAHKTVIQTLLVVCGVRVRVQRAVIAAGWSQFVIRNADELLWSCTAVVLLFYCFTVVLLLYCCTAVVLLLYCCFTVVLLLYCCCSAVALLYCCCITVVLLFYCCTAVVLLLYCCCTVVLLLYCCCIVVLLLYRCTAVVLLLYCCCTADSCTWG